jgi:hypothetical protein
MTPSSAKVIVAHMGHAIRAKATDVIFTKTSHATAAQATAAQATHVTSTKAAHTSSTKAAHVAPAAHATTVSSATTTAAAAGLRARGKKAAGKQCGCQNHRYSSSHDILHLSGRTFPPQGLVRRWRVSAKQSQRRDGLEMGFLICRLY